MADTSTLAQRFGANLRKRRRQLGMRQADLAELLNTHVPYISDLEHGKRKPRFDTIERLADALKTSPEKLLKGEKSLA